MKLYLVALFGFVGLSVVLSQPSLAFAETKTATNQIEIKAIILPARYVIVNSENDILQIISNTSETDVELSIYQSTVRPENAVVLTNSIESDVARLLSGKLIKPGILYDSKTGSPSTSKSTINQKSPEYWLSGIFNLKNLSPTVK